MEAARQQPAELAHCESIFVIKPSSLGDIVHTLPAAAALKKAAPQARLSWLVNSEWAPLLQDNPDVDDVLIFPRNAFRERKWNIMASWLRATRNLQPDLVLDFQGLLRSALIARLSRAERIWGLSDAREGAALFYDRVVQVESRQHAVDRYLQMVAALGVTVERPLKFTLPKGEQPAGFEHDERFLLLHPFSRGAGKSLTIGQIKELCAQLAPMGVVIAGRTDEKLHGAANCIDLTNQTALLELIWLIRHARFVVSVDSGPMHIAAALTDRLLGIHTWSDPRRVGPYNPDGWVWKAGKIVRVKEMTAPIAEQTAEVQQEHIDQIAAFVKVQ